MTALDYSAADSGHLAVEIILIFSLAGIPFGRQDLAVRNMPVNNRCWDSSKRPLRRVGTRGTQRQPYLIRAAADEAAAIVITIQLALFG